MEIKRTEKVEIEERKKGKERERYELAYLNKEERFFRIDVFN
jgi:hypothetical protein